MENSAIELCNDTKRSLRIHYKTFHGIETTFVMNTCNEF